MPLKRHRRDSSNLAAITFSAAHSQEWCDVGIGAPIRFGDIHLLASKAINPPYGQTSSKLSTLIHLVIAMISNLLLAILASRPVKFPQPVRPLVPTKSTTEITLNDERSNANCHFHRPSTIEKWVRWPMSLMAITSE
jgi:hypothetical protein